MKPRAVLFDLYGTLIDISTDEYRSDLWEAISRFLAYRGLSIDGTDLRRRYFQTVESDLRASDERHPEVDVVDVYRRILVAAGYEGANAFFEEVAQLFRALSLQQFGAFDDTIPVLTALRDRFKLGLVSDSQGTFTRPELLMTGLLPLFDAIVVSSDHGYRKPDPRLFDQALGTLGTASGKAVHVGNSIKRDICGAQRAGIVPVFLNRSGQARDVTWRCHPVVTFETLYELKDWLISS